MPEREVSYAEAIREALSDAMRADERVFLIGEDIGVYGGAFGVTAGLLEEFGPARVRDTPISEVAIVGAAVGAALLQMRPIAEMQFSDFTANAMDQLVNQAAKLRFMYGGGVTVPMVLRAPAGSGTGAAAQHSQSIESWILNVPGLKVVMPATPADAKGLLTAAIDDPNPVVVLEHKLLYRTKGSVPKDRHSVPIGSANVVRDGADLTIVVWSAMVLKALAAAADLHDQGIDAEVLDLRTLRPLDRQSISASVSKTGRVLIVHEAPRTGGFGGEVAASVAEGEAFDFLDAPVRRLAGLETPIPYNPELERGVVPQQEDIVKAGVDLMSE
jgi:acetoin:2,6-dichlorophenolindophenol oxidoreductase subunit beta